MRIRHIAPFILTVVLGGPCLTAHATTPGALTCASASEAIALKPWKLWIVRQLGANDPKANAEMPMVKDILAGNVAGLRSELLSRHADPNAQLKVTVVMSLSPLTLAIDACQVGAASVLIEDGANVNGNSPDDSPLPQAAGRGEAELVAFMLSQGAEVNRPNKLGDTALEEAVLNHDYNTSRVLVEEGHANINQTSYRGASLLALASDSKIPEDAKIAELLQRHGGKVIYGSLRH